MFISDNNKYSLLFIFIVSDLVYIYFRDSTYNFRLWYSILECITENLKSDCYNIKQEHMKVLARVSILLLIQTHLNLTKRHVTEFGSSEYIRY